MRNLLRKLRDRRGVLRRIRSACSDFEGIERYTAEAMAEYLKAQQVDVLRHCLDRIPYYQTALRQASVVSIDDWLKIPILTKTVLREHAESMVDSVGTYGWIRKNTSGGSTGEPVEFLQDDSYQVKMCAMKRIYDSWTGYAYGDPKVIIWGSERDILEGGEHWRVRVARWLQNESWVNAFQMSEAAMHAAILEINKKKPVQILAYVEAISTLCKFIRKHNLKVHAPQGIMTSAGTLYPEIKQEIEEVFQAPVFNRYGSRELGDIACSRSDTAGLLVHPATHYVEVVRDDDSLCEVGEPGRIIVTCFTNRVMPLLRYEVGDIGVMGEVPQVDRPQFQVLRQVKGRVSDTFIAPDGSKVHGEFFTHLLYHKPWVKQFQFHQKSDGSIEIMVVLNAEVEDARLRAHCAEVDGKIYVLMGKSCLINWKLVDEIPPHRNGKFRYVISDFLSSD